MTWSFIEPCAGGAALTLHLLGAKGHLVPYQGGKWRYREKLAAVLAGRGFTERPDEVYLFDCGPWGKTWQALTSDKARVLDHLGGMAGKDPKEVYDHLHGKPASDDPYRFAAEFLFLQRLAHSGKAVGVSASGRWMSPGFNKTSAYGVEGTERFGAVAPMIPSLVRRLEELDFPSTFRCFFERARPVPSGAKTAVYLDPPYRGSTPYPNGSLLREEVVALALAYAGSGATVLVSEAEPLEELTRLGWNVVEIQPPRTDGSPFKGKQSEYVTISPRG